MKTTLKKTLALALALVMCLGMLPTGAMAEVTDPNAGGSSGSGETLPTTISFTRTPTLTGGDSPNLSVGWRYDDVDLPSGTYAGEVYAWKDDGNSARPTLTWYNDYKVSGGSSNSFAGTLKSSSTDSTPSALSGDCYVQVKLTLSDSQELTSAPVMVTIPDYPAWGNISATVTTDGIWSVNWDYENSATLPEIEGNDTPYQAVFEAWAGTDTEAPSTNYWYTYISWGEDTAANAVYSSGGRYSGTPTWYPSSGTASTLSEGDTCRVRIRITNNATWQTVMTSQPVQVTVVKTDPTQHAPANLTAEIIGSEYDSDMEKNFLYTQVTWDADSLINSYSFYPTVVTSSGAEYSLGSEFTISTEGGGDTYYWVSNGRGTYTFKPVLLDDAADQFYTDATGNHAIGVKIGDTVKYALAAKAGGTPSAARTVQVSVTSDSLDPMAALAPKNVTFQFTGFETTGSTRYALANISWDAMSEINGSSRYFELYSDFLPAGSEMKYNWASGAWVGAYSTLPSSAYTTTNGRTTVSVKIKVLSSSETQLDTSSNSTLGFKTSGDKAHVRLFTENYLGQRSEIKNIWAEYSEANVTSHASFTAEGEVPTLAISTASLPEATVGKSYSATLSGTAANGGALSWSLTSGSLPAGLSLSTAGAISGTPTAAGESTFEVTLTEAGGGSVKKQLTLKVSNAAPKINVKVLPQAVRNVSYSVPLTGTASGGGTLTWSLEDGSELPTRLNLAADGTLSGTVTAAAGSYPFTVVLTEAGVPDTAKQALTLSVRERYTRKVTYALNGGTAADAAAVADKTLTEDETETWNVITLPAAPSKTGYQFDDWKAGGSKYKAGASVTVTADMSFIAQWKDPAPLTATYAGQVVGSYDLLGVKEDGTVWLGMGQADTPRSLTGDYAMTVPWSYLRNYEFTAIELRAYVDGTYQTVARYDGEPTADFTLTAAEGMTNLHFITDVAAKDPGGAALTRGTDFSYSSLRLGNTYLNLPCMTTKTTGFSVYVYGVSSSESYTKYKWKTYDNVPLVGTAATVTLEPMPTGVTLSGHVYFGEGTESPLAGVKVQFTQYWSGRAMNFTATTDAYGAYTVEGLQKTDNDNSVGEVWYSVLSAGGTSMTRWSTSFPVTAESGHTQAGKDFHISAAVASLEVGLDLSDSPDLNATQRSAVRYGSPYSGWIKFSTSNNFTGSTANRVCTGGTAYHYLNGFNANGTVYYEITGSGLQKKTGSFTLKNGVYSTPYNDPITVKPMAGVVVPLSSPTTCDYALAWFSDAGAFVGASDSISVSGYTSNYYFPAPGGAAGTYTVALIPTTVAGTLNGASTLDGLGGNKLTAWTVTLSANVVEPLEPYAISKADSEDAAYVTKPNSTMTADREAFSSTADLVRFTGSIGLDSGLTEGKLTGLTINVRNDAEGISYSNTAPIQYVVLNGELYGVGNGDKNFVITNTGYYDKGGLSIDLPCDYTVYCKPGNDDWDMQVNMYASVSYKSGGTSHAVNSQLVGAATVKKPGASITTLSSYVCTDTVAVKGTTNANGSVDIYDGETLIGSATANKKGLWEATVTLAGAETPKDGIAPANCYATTHILTSRTANGTVSDPLYVFHDPSGPQLTSFRMGWDKWGHNEINVGDGYTFTGSMSELTFKATFRNAGKLRPTRYGDTDAQSSEVAFRYYLTNGTIGTIYADTVTNNADGTVTFSGKLDHTVYSSVTAAEVLFDPILNNRPVSADGSTHALTETDLAEYKDALNAAKNAKLLDSGGSDRTADADALATVNQKYAGTGMTVQALAVEYDDGTGFLQWMNESAADWTSGNLEAHSVGIYNKSVVFAKKADFDAQLAQLKAYATWKSDLENSSSSVTASQLFFTDMKYDGDLNLTDKGTYFAEFNAFSDTGRELYAIIGALSLDSSFQHYATNLPNNVAATTAWSGSSIGDVTLTRFWGNETSNDNVSTTEKALMKYAEGGGIEKLFSIGPPNPVEIYHDIKNNSTEYINTTTNSEMQALGARVDAHNIENSKE